MPETQAPAVAVCWSCTGRIEAADPFCRHCGSGQGEHLSWYYRWWGLALLAVGGLGPFVLPMIWRSPALSKQGKAMGTALTVLFTVWMLWRLYSLVEGINAALSGSNLTGLQLP